MHTVRSKSTLSVASMLGMIFCDSVVEYKVLAPKLYYITTSAGSQEMATLVIFSGKTMTAIFSKHQTKTAPMDKEERSKKSYRAHPAIDCMSCYRQVRLLDRTKYM